MSEIPVTPPQKLPVLPTDSPISPSWVLLLALKTAELQYQQAQSISETKVFLSRPQGYSLITVDGWDGTAVWQLIKRTG